MTNNTTPIYRVSTEADADGNKLSTIGYATGRKEDIESYYSTKKAYTLQITPIAIKHITLEMIKTQKRLRNAEETLEKKLAGVRAKKEA